MWVLLVTFSTSGVVMRERMCDSSFDDKWALRDFLPFCRSQLLGSGPCNNVIIDALNYFLGFKRRNSLTKILTNLGLPSFDTDTVCSFQNLWTLCSNHLVVHLRD